MLSSICYILWGRSMLPVRSVRRSCITHLLPSTKRIQYPFYIPQSGSLYFAYTHVGANSLPRDVHHIRRFGEANPIFEPFILHLLSRSWLPPWSVVALEVMIPSLRCLSLFRPWFRPWDVIAFEVLIHSWKTHCLRGPDLLLEVLSLEVIIPSSRCQWLLRPPLFEVLIPSSSLLPLRADSLFEVTFLRGPDSLLEALSCPRLPDSLLKRLTWPCSSSYPLPGVLWWYTFLQSFPWYAGPCGSKSIGLLEQDSNLKVPSSLVLNYSLDGHRRPSFLKFWYSSHGPSGCYWMVSWCAPMERLRLMS